MRSRFYTETLQIELKGQMLTMLGQWVLSVCLGLVDSWSAPDRDRDMEAKPDLAGHRMASLSPVQARRAWET